MGSGIIFNGGSTGGGGLNPSANFIPLNNGTSSFVDSNIEIVLGSNIRTYNYPNADLFGLNIEFASGTVI